MQTRRTATDRTTVGKERKQRQSKKGWLYMETINIEFSEQLYNENLTC